LRGEPLDLVSRELGIPAARLTTWREAFLAAGQTLDADIVVSAADPGLAALVTRDPNSVCRALMTMSAGEAAEDLNLDLGPLGVEKSLVQLEEERLRGTELVDRVRHNGIMTKPPM
jgi:hypothetical protein